ncbi:alpha beta-hydrolase [Mycena floridula]|nr:alpha beta-hydrolase [Mycena floridula]
MSEPPTLAFREKVSMNLLLLQIPFLLLYTSIIGRWSKVNAGRPMNRILFHRTAQFILNRLSVRQLQAISGTTVAAYKKWAEQTKVEPVIDTLPGGTLLMWVGPRELDRVVVYCHGGGFVGPLSDFQVEYWHRIKKSLLEEHGGLKLGVAVLQYSLNPVSFPAQLKELTLAVQHIMSTGVPASKIYIAGDSAGGNLVIQLLNLILHPSDAVSESFTPISVKGFAGACLISPWLIDDQETDSVQTNSRFDLIQGKVVGLWRDAYLQSIPDSQRVFVQPNTTPENWFKGVQNVVKRIMITGGGREILRDSIVQFSATLQEFHNDVTVDIFEEGTHCDAMFALAAKSLDKHPAELKMVNWFVESIAAE